MNSVKGIYIHIPFCVKKCNYCDFLSYPATGEEQNRYTECLVREITCADYLLEHSERRADTIFFGGGTPAILSLSNLDQIFSAIYNTFQVESSAEITIECNPGTADYDKFEAYRRFGVNRISFGVQSASGQELNILGRIHSFQHAVKSVQHARKAGFSNLNVDVMSAIPGQTKESYQDTLKRILALEPEHISAYSLIIEEGTPFYDLYHKEPPVDEDTDREMYAATKQILADAGYERYEISNYAKPGYECRHNLKYWSGDDYIGFGLGAGSRIGNKRYRNIEEPHLFENKTKNGESAAVLEEILDQKNQMSEFFILGLRKTKGVSLREFEQLFFCSPFEVYGETIQKFIEYGLLVRTGQQLQFTDRGLDISNFVLQEFI